MTNAYGKVIEQEVVVSTYHDSDAPQPYPIALINHGRSVKPEERAAYGRQTSITNARWLAAMGFLVVVPTRIGYDQTQGHQSLAEFLALTSQTQAQHALRQLQHAHQKGNV